MPCSLYLMSSADFEFEESQLPQFWKQFPVRTVIDIHFFSIRSLTFYFSIPIISIQFWRTALIEYFHMFHTIFVARILRFSQCKDNEGFLNTFWLNTWVSLPNSKKALAKNGVKGWKYVFWLIDITIDIIIFSINWKNYFDRSILVISMTVLSSLGRVIVYLNLLPQLPFFW